MISKRYRSNRTINHVTLIIKRAGFMPNVHKYRIIIIEPHHNHLSSALIHARLNQPEIFCSMIITFGACGRNHNYISNSLHQYKEVKK